MRRITLIILPLLLLLAAPVHAATYWVSPTGAAGSSGADSLGNAKTLAWFNANALAGDICRFKSGTYADPIQPARSGTSANRIRYYGLAQDPGGVVVRDVHFGYAVGSYCTVRWVSSTGNVAGMTEAAGMEATDDSIVACRFTGQTDAFSICSMRSVVDSLMIVGTYAKSGQTHAINLTGERDHANGSIGEWTVGTRSNSFTNSTVTMTVNCPGDFHGLFIAAAVGNKILGNTFNITVANVSGYFFGVEMYEGYSNQLQNNTWNIALNGPIAGSHGVWCHRDSSSYNRWVGNNVNVTGSGSDLSFMLSNGGSFGNTTGHNYYGNNIIKDHSPQSGTGILWWYDGSRQDTVEFNTIMTDAARPCLSIPSGQQVNGSVFRHNTYWTGGATAVEFSAASAVNTPRMSSEVVYCRSANGSGAENMRVPAGMKLDSAGVFFSLGSASSGRAISYGGVAGAPGSGGNYGQAGKALWGSPVFTDSTYANFMGKPGGLGYAVGANLVDGFAGAVPFLDPSPDVTPPATVTDLAVALTGPLDLSISWTAPGNDGMTGTASIYELRWSNSLITSANFAAATAVTIQPIPATAGTPQTWLGLGLAPLTTFYYAIRTRDAAGNWSAVSNSASGTTSVLDLTPPAAIHDLSTGL